MSETCCTIRRKRHTWYHTTVILLASHGIQCIGDRKRFSWLRPKLSPTNIPTGFADNSSKWSTRTHRHVYFWTVGKCPKWRPIHLHHHGLLRKANTRRSHGQYHHYATSVNLLRPLDCTASGTDLSTYRQLHAIYRNSFEAGAVSWASRRQHTPEYAQVHIHTNRRAEYVIR